MIKTMDVFKNEIDFVVTWVDGENPLWKRQMLKYKKMCNALNYLNGQERFRSSFELLELWLIGVKKYAPWVRFVFLIVDPITKRKCMSLQSNKVRVISHEEFIPMEFLPTYNSNVIELNIHKLSGLSNNFVLFNDDCFVMNDVEPTDFFFNNTPVDYDVNASLEERSRGNDIHINDLNIIKRIYDFQDYRIKYLFKFGSNLLDKGFWRTVIGNALTDDFIGWRDEHLPVSYSKRDFERAFLEDRKLLINQSKRRFRSESDLTHHFIKYNRIISGDYIHRKSGVVGKYIEMNEDIDETLQGYEKRRLPKILCINDIQSSEDNYQHALKSVKRFLVDAYGCTT